MKPETLTEVRRQTYGHDGRAINRHSERWYRDEAGNLYVLSKTLDGVPPFFEAYGPFGADHQGLLPRLRVAGEEYWGSGWPWARAVRAFTREIQSRKEGRADTTSGRKVL